MPVERTQEVKVLVKLGDGSHVRSIQLKVKDAGVLNHTGGGHTLGQGHGAALNGPAQRNLSD